MRALSVVSRSPEETRILGAALAAAVLPGDIVSLSGDLGAGKTVFVQGFARALGVETPVTSPSFTLVNHYEGRFSILHLDVYRLDSFQEVIDLGFDELLGGEAVAVVEWGEAVQPLLPRGYLEVVIELGDPEGPEDERMLTFTPQGREWISKLHAMRSLGETLLDAASDDPDPTARFWTVGSSRGRDDMDATDG